MSWGGLSISKRGVPTEMLSPNPGLLIHNWRYQGFENREEMVGKQVECRIAMRPGKRRQLPDTPEGRLQELCEKAKAHIRAKVEHVFRVLKQQLGFSKTRLRELKKNRSRLWVLAASIQSVLRQKTSPPGYGVGHRSSVSTRCSFCPNSAHSGPNWGSNRAINIPIAHQTKKLAASTRHSC